MSLAVLTCHFNPAGYRAPRRNLLRFSRQLQAEGVPLFIAELAYDHQPWFLPEDAGVLQIRTQRRHIMWHKENLLNMLERMVPPEFEALAWIDADLWFQRLDWYDATIEALQERAVVQLFHEVVQTGQDGTVARRIPGAAAAGVYCPGKTTPGFAWAARRTLWQQGGGLYQRAIIGGGDALHASVWLPTVNDPTPWLNYAGTPESLRELRNWCAAEGKCGAVSGVAWHEWHGDYSNRRYVERQALMKHLNVENELISRPDGLLEYSDSVSDLFRTNMVRYFCSRNEDGSASAGAPD